MIAKRESTASVTEVANHVMCSFSIWPYADQLQALHLRQVNEFLAGTGSWQLATQRPGGRWCAAIQNGCVLASGKCHLKARGK